VDATPDASVRARDALLRPGERIDGDFVVVTASIDGRDVTLLRRRSTGETWRLDAGGAWTQVDADGHRSARTPNRKQRAKALLHFHGPVDGSDEIRIDAAGATWWSRHWGLPHGSATLNDITFTPRACTTLANTGETRFLPSGVRFATGRLVRAEGRDLIALETAADHVTLKVSDSPNGPGVYDVVIEFETEAPADSRAAARSLSRGLVAHLPLIDDFTDASTAKLGAQPGTVRIAEHAAVFDGTSSVDLPHVDVAGRAFAVAVDVRVEGDAPTMGLLEQRAGNATNEHLHLMLRDGQRPYFGFYLNDLIADRPVPRDGAFHRLVFQYTGEEQEIWMDGVRIAHRRSGPYLGRTGATRIGRNPDWSNVGGSHFVGGLRDVRIYDRALSVGEVGALPE
jgi:hypothetical protein